MGEKAFEDFQMDPDVPSNDIKVFWGPERPHKEGSQEVLEGPYIF